MIAHPPRHTRTHPDARTLGRLRERLVAFERAVGDIAPRQAGAADVRAALGRARKEELPQRH